MKFEYWLIDKDGVVLPISIQEEAKEYFKKLMGWSEKQFRKHTCRKVYETFQKNRRQR